MSRRSEHPRLLVDIALLVSQSEKLRPALTPPPHDAPDVCPVCRSWLNTDEGVCGNCLQVQTELGRPATQIIPISLYHKPSALRDWLKYYKPNDEGQLPSYEPHIGAILGRYLLEHGQALQEFLGGYEAVCVVPSSTRPGQHILSALYQSWAPSGSADCLPLLVRGSGEVGHRRMSDDAFKVVSEVDSQRILLLDDVYTTGGTAQSAASALHLVGAIVPAVLVIARRLNPDYDAGVAAIWDRQRSIRFDFTRNPFWRKGRT